MRELKRVLWGAFEDRGLQETGLLFTFIQARTIHQMKIWAIRFCFIIASAVLCYIVYDGDAVRCA